MSVLRTIALAGALAVVVPCAAAEAKPRMHTLKLVAPAATVERAFDDVLPEGASKGDAFISSSELSNRAGRVVGKYDLVCRIIDEDDGGTARSICTSVTTITGRGQIVAVGTVRPLPNPALKGPFGIAPTEEVSAIVGGTGRYLAARGELVAHRTDTERTLTFRYAR